MHKGIPITPAQAADAMRARAKEHDGRLHYFVKGSMRETSVAAGALDIPFSAEPESISFVPGHPYGFDLTMTVRGEVWQWQVPTPEPERILAIGEPRREDDADAILCRYGDTLLKALRAAALRSEKGGDSGEYAKAAAAIRAYIHPDDD